MPLEIVDDYRESAFAQAQTGLLFNLPVPSEEHEQLPAGVSLCMIVKNEERFLAECLASVRDCVDEINVVDTGSTDRTVEIARSFGANVIHREWRNDFAWARNEALAMATRRWILVLDADEEVAPESGALVRALGGTPADVTAVYTQIENVIDDESGRATMSHYLARLIPNTPRIRYRNVIHENVCLDENRAELAIAMSPIRLLHKGYTKAMLEGRNKGERNRPLLEKAIREQGDDAFSWFNFGVAAVAAGEHDAGIEALHKMFEIADRERAFWPIAYVMLATGYAEGKGDFERGIAILDDGLKNTPDHPNLVFTKGYFLSLQGRYDEARACYERAVGLRHSVMKHFMVDDEIGLWKAAYNLASTFLKEQRFDEAIPWLERVVEAKPDSSLLRAATARTYERAGRVYDAERLYRTAAQRDGDDGVIALVNFLMRRRRFGEAFEIVEHGEQRLGDRAYASLLLSAAVATRDERLGDPEPYVLRALERVPGHGQALGFLDELYAARGETVKRDALRARELDAPLEASGDYARRSHRLLEEHRVDDALAAAELGLQASPRDGTLRYNAALAAALAGRDDEARAHLDAVPDADRLATAAVALRVQLECRAGDLDAAVAAVRRASELPVRDETRLRQAAVGVATALLEAGRLDEAGRLADAVLS